MPAFRIRPATPEDARALVDIENSTFSSDRISPRQMRHLLTRGKAATFVAVADNDELLGYVMVLLPAPPKPCRIYSLAVGKEHRGKKIASGLMEQMLAYVRERQCQRIRLEVRAADLNVQAIYQHFGFFLVRRIRGYYQDGEDALRMELPLNS